MTGKSASRALRRTSIRQLASAATEVVATKSSQIGSIGVVWYHESIAKLMARAGIEPTVLSTAPHKADGNPMQPLSPEAKERMQAYHRMFVHDVAAGRNVSMSHVEAKFGQGAMLLASDAKAVGMIDRVADVPSTMRRLMAMKPAAAARPRIAASAVPKDPRLGSFQAATAASPRDVVRAQRDAWLARRFKSKAK
jgi:ClpP class serine protease